MHIITVIFTECLYDITALYDQADLFTSYLLTLQNTTTSIYKHIPFTKAARDTGD